MLHQIGVLLRQDKGASGVPTMPPMPPMPLSAFQVKYQAAVQRQAMMRRSEFLCGNCGTTTFLSKGQCRNCASVSGWHLKAKGSPPVGPPQDMTRLFQHHARRRRSASPAKVEASAKPSPPPPPPPASHAISHRRHGIGLGCCGRWRSPIQRHERLGAQRRHAADGDFAQADGRNAHAISSRRVEAEVELFENREVAPMTTRHAVDDCRNCCQESCPGARACSHASACQSQCKAARLPECGGRSSSDSRACPHRSKRASHLSRWPCTVSCHSARSGSYQRSCYHTEAGCHNWAEWSTYDERCGATAHSGCIAGNSQQVALPCLVYSCRSRGSYCSGTCHASAMSHASRLHRRCQDPKQLRQENEREGEIGAIQSAIRRGQKPHSAKQSIGTGNADVLIGTYLVSVSHVMLAPVFGHWIEQLRSACDTQLRLHHVLIALWKALPSTVLCHTPVWDDRCLSGKHSCLFQLVFTSFIGLGLLCFAAALHDIDYLSAWIGVLILTLSVMTWWPWMAGLSSRTACSPLAYAPAILLASCVLGGYSSLHIVMCI